MVSRSPSCAGREPENAERADARTATWFRILIKEDLGSATQVAQALAALREEGPALGRPLVNRLKGTRIHRLKELRPPSRGYTEIRIIFVFDPNRSALLLLGGDKAALGVSISRVSQIEHGEVASFEVIARYVEALGAPGPGGGLRRPGGLRNVEVLGVKRRRALPAEGIGQPGLRQETAQ